MTERPSHILVGKTITAVHLATDKKAIKFDVLDGEPIVALADGDCCSYSWIESVEAPDVLCEAAGPVLDAKNIQMPDLGTPLDAPDDVVVYYGFMIRTSRGTCIIDYRNANNGYYGGNLSWPDDYFYGGVFDQNESTQEWKVLT